jgi:tetratricopeptide (TPR) repeat protein
MSIGDFLKATTHDPQLIVLEDIHATGVPSLLLLRFLISDLRTSRVMIIATHRSGETTEPTQSGLIAELAKDASNIHLTGFSGDEVANFVENLSDGAVSKRTIASIRKITKGNPFFIRELARLSFGGRPASKDANVKRFDIPDGIRVAVRQRLELIKPATIELLNLASVLGQEFDLTMLQVASEQPIQEVLAIVEDAVKGSLLTETRDRVGRYAFNHALIGETLYADLSLLQRRALHLRIAEKVEHLHENGRADCLTDLAFHYQQALPLGSPRKAIDFSRAAGDRARESFAYEEAADFYQSALQIADCGTEHSPEEQCELLLDLASVRILVGDFASSQELLRKAIDLVRQRHDPIMFANTVLAYTNRPGHPSLADKEVVELCEEALRTLGPEDSAARAKLLIRLANEMPEPKAEQQREQSSQEAIKVATRIEDRQCLAEVLVNNFYTLRGPGKAEHRLAALDSIEKLRNTGLVGIWAFNAHYYRASVLMELGEVAEAYAEVEALNNLPLYQKQQVLGFCETANAMRAINQGRFDEARKLVADAFQLLQGRPNNIAPQMYASQMLIICREQGRLSEIEPMLFEFAARQSKLMLARCAVAFCHAESGRREEARSEFDYLAKDDFAGIPSDYTWLCGMAWLAEVSSYLGDQARASVIYEQMLPYRDRNVTLALQLCLGSVPRFLGVLAATMGRRDDAEQHFKTALDRNRLMFAPPWVARTKFDYASLLIDRNQPGDRERAHTLLLQTTNAAQELGMPVLAEKARQLRGRVSLDSAQTQPVFRPGSEPARFAIPRPAESKNIFRKEGRSWTVVFEGRASRLRDSKGFKYLSQLLRYPHIEFHAHDLVFSSSTKEELRPATADLLRAGDEMADAPLSPRSSDAGEMLDEPAKAAYPGFPLSKCTTNVVRPSGAIDRRGFGSDQGWCGGEQPVGEDKSGPFQLSFNSSLRVDFQGARVTSDGGLILVRELDERLGLSELIEQYLADSRGKNAQIPLADLLRQSVYSRLAGYEDLNDAERLSQDPAFRLIGSRKIWERGAALTSRLQSFETELLTQEDNLAGLAALNRQLVAKAEAIDSPRRIVLDMDSTEIPVYGE